MGKKKNKLAQEQNQLMQGFNERLFDPSNATIDHSEKLRIQELAARAASGNPKDVQAYHQAVYGSGLLQSAKDEMANAFTYRKPAAPAPKPARNPANRAAGMKEFNEGLYSNTSILNEDKMRISDLAGKASSGDPRAIKAFHEAIYGSGMQQSDKDAFAGKYTYSRKPKPKPQMQATLPKEERQAAPAAKPAAAPPAESAKERMQKKYKVRPRGNRFTSPEDLFGIM